MYLCMHICMYMQICMHECILVNIYVCIHAYRHAYMHRHTCIHMHWHVLCRHASIIYAHTYLCTYACRHLCMHVSIVHKHSYIYVYMHVCRRARLYVLLGNNRLFRFCASILYYLARAANFSNLGSRKRWRLQNEIPNPPHLTHCLPLSLSFFSLRSHKINSHSIMTEFEHRLC